jgi:hypothetical protein
MFGFRSIYLVRSAEIVNKDLENFSVWGGHGPNHPAKEDKEINQWKFYPSSSHVWIRLGVLFINFVAGNSFLQN